MTATSRISGLYVIVDPTLCGDRAPLDVARLALEGGARVIQWRDKRRDKGDQLADAKALAGVCHDHGALLIVNDHADLAASAGADGVHLGQHDLPISAVRPLVGEDFLIGVSTNNAEEAIAAEAAGADYVAVGAIFPTASKELTRPASPQRIRELKASVNIPVVAIGGINLSNVGEVVEAGADAAAVISAVCGAADVAEAAASLTSAFAPLSISQTRRDLVERFVETLNERDRDGFIRLFTADGIIQGPDDKPPYVGHEGICLWWDGLTEPQNNYEVRVDATHFAGEEAAIIWTISHRHDRAVPDTRGIAVLSFDGGLIASCVSYRSHGQSSHPKTQPLVDELTRALNNRDKSSYLALFAADAIQQEPVGTTPRVGLGAISAWWDTRMSAYSSYRLKANLVCESGAETAVAWSVATEVEGATFAADGVDILTIDGAGRIASVHSYWDVDAQWPTPARQVTADSSHMALVASHFIEAINNRDRAAFLDLFVEDCVLQGPRHPEPFIGRPGLEAWWDHVIPGGEFRIELDAVHTVPDMAALVWTNAGKTPGSTTPLRGIEILTFEEGRLASVSSFRTHGNEPDPRPREVAHAFTDALNARDRDAFLALWSKDGMRQDPPDMIPIIGIEAIGREFDEMLRRFPDYTMHAQEICVSGNEAAIAWRTENHAGDAPPVVEGVVVLELDAEGKIAAQHSYYSLS